MRWNSARTNIAPVDKAAVLNTAVNLRVPEIRGYWDVCCAVSATQICCAVSGHAKFILVVPRHLDLESHSEHDFTYKKIVPRVKLHNIYN